MAKLTLYTIGDLKYFLETEHSGVSSTDFSLYLHDLGICISDRVCDPTELSDRDSINGELETPDILNYIREFKDRGGEINHYLENAYY